MNRPVDTVTHIGDYLWWLLPGPRKRKAKADSTLYGLLYAVGESLEGARAALAEVPLQALVATATGTYLDELGRKRETYRVDDESDENYRVRVLAAFENKQKDGTLPGMQAALEALGYTVTITEPHKGTAKWAHFLITVTAWNGVVADQMLFFKTVRAQKPAHARAVIASELEPGRFDDGGNFDDEGCFDDWLPSD